MAAQKRKKQNKKETKIVKKTDIKDVITSQVKALKIKRKHVFAVLAVVILSALIFNFKDLIIAASVNGQPITRIAVVQELEKHSGQQALDSLITQTLVEQEARNENVTVSDSELNDEVKKIEDSVKSQGQDLETALASEGLTRQDLNDQLRLQVLVQKMVGKTIQVSDQEVSDYIKNNASLFPKTMSAEDQKNKATSDLKEQKTSDQLQTWIAGLKTKAKINYFVRY